MTTAAANKQKKVMRYALILIAILVLVIILGIFFGSESVRLFGMSADEKAIVFDIRLPRVLLAVGVGGSLALSGAALQSMLRNPLAEPYLLGVSNGAALGTMLSFILLQQIEFSRPVFAFIGAVAASAVVYLIAKGRAGVSVERLVLAGVIITTLLSSVMVLLTSLLDATRLRSYTFWLLGDLSQATFNGVILAVVAMILGIVILTFYAKELNLMMIGERDAADFGVEVGQVRLVVFGTAAMMIGASVASSGSVGYVGLIVPHIVRLIFGSDNRFVLPFSAMAGAAFVVTADLIARVAIAPRELPVGAITALLGAPMFIFLLVRNRA